MAPGNILVLGVGNLLLGDEGAGIHAAWRLEHTPFPPAVTVVDGGTGGFHLLSYFSDYETIVMLDATLDGMPPGTVSLIEPRFASDFPRALSAHDIGLRDLIEAAALLGPLPRMYLVTVSADTIAQRSVLLSPQVEASLDAACDMVRTLVGSLVGEGPASEAPGQIGIDSHTEQACPRQVFSRRGWG
jgi:hydrogenase maturation protease